MAPAANSPYLFPMPREIDEKKRRKALRKLRKAAELAEKDGREGLSDWERTFVDEVQARIETFGSAFADPEKGRLDEPLSARQTQKLKEIAKKGRGDGASAGFSRSSFKPKRPTRPSNARDIHDDLEIDAEAAPSRPNKERADGPRLVSSCEEPPASPSEKAKRPRLTVLKGGRE